MPPPPSGFLDFAQIASLYSQLAGVLAGFAFAGLIAVATVRLSSGHETIPFVTAAYRPLVCSFFALVAASLNYAVSAGDPSGTGRSAAVKATAGVSFCAAGCLLLFSILVTLDSVECARPDGTGNARKAVELVRRLLAITVPPLFVLLFVPALRDQSAVEYGSPYGSTPLVVESVILFLVCVVAGVTFFGLFARFAARRRRVDLLSAPGITVTVMATLLTSLYLSFLPADVTLPDWVPAIELFVVAALGVTTSVAACIFQADIEPRRSDRRSWAARHRDHDDPQPTNAAVPEQR